MPYVSQGVIASLCCAELAMTLKARAHPDFVLDSQRSLEKQLTDKLWTVTYPHLTCI